MSGHPGMLFQHLRWRLWNNGLRQLVAASFVRLVTILLAYSVPGGAGGSLVGTAAAVLAFPVAGGVWNVDAAEAVAEGA